MSDLKSERTKRAMLDKLRGRQLLDPLALLKMSKQGELRLQEMHQASGSGSSNSSGPSQPRMAPQAASWQQQQQHGWQPKHLVSLGWVTSDVAVEQALAASPGMSFCRDPAAAAPNAAQEPPSPAAVPSHALGLSPPTVHAAAPESAPPPAMQPQRAPTPAAPSAQVSPTANHMHSSSRQPPPPFFTLSTQPNTHSSFLFSGRPID